MARNQNKGVLLGTWLELALFVLAHILIFTLVFHSLYKMPWTPIIPYFDYASKVLNGNMPYLDFSLEYPPLSLFFFILPRLITSTYTTYVILYQTELLIFNLVGLYLIYRIAQCLRKAPWKMLTVYTVAILAIGPIIVHQYDIFPAIMVLLSLYFFWQGKHKTSWALLALGTMTKLYPAVIAPVFLIYYIRNRQYRNIRSGIITFTVICLAIVLPFLIISPESILSLISYHGQRGIQVESIYSALLLFADKFGLTSVSVVVNYGSRNLSSPLADTLAKLSTYLLAFFLLISYWFIYCQMKPGKSQSTRIGAYSLLVITITLIASKVLSPQYLIWLIPLIPLIFGPLRYTILVLFVAIGVLTYYIFPSHYLAFWLDLDFELIAIVLLRNILLFLVAVLAVISLIPLREDYY